MAAPQQEWAPSMARLLLRMLLLDLAPVQMVLVQAVHLVVHLVVLPPAPPDILVEIIFEV